MITFSAMALFGDVTDLARLLAGDPRFLAAFRYLERCLDPASSEALRIGALPEGKVEQVPLEGGAVAMDQVYVTRGRADCFFESHRKYIDVQCILAGEEAMDVIGLAALEVEKPYRDSKDVVMYRDPGTASRLLLKAGQAAVFFPEDGHMPGQAIGEARLVRKTVIKVPVAP